MTSKRASRRPHCRRVPPWAKVAWALAAMCGVCCDGSLNDRTDLLPEIAVLSSPFGSSPERVGAVWILIRVAGVNREATRRFRQFTSGSRLSFTPLEGKIGECDGFESTRGEAERGYCSTLDASLFRGIWVEQQLFGCEIRNIVAVGGPKRTGEVKVERWGDELRRSGFRPVSLQGNPAAQAGLLLGMFPWKGYTLVEENGCLKLGWKDLSLLTASAWQPSD
ncbi:hypothetical protein NC651_014939 [Populus alba x Populus x berolinensis]|nr:hypothetical protein NC651_014939 [Populus alba x Populus x berolinensis]